jgi:hypothetical protein
MATGWFDTPAQTCAASAQSMVDHQMASDPRWPGTISWRLSGSAASPTCRVDAWTLTSGVHVIWDAAFETRTGDHCMPRARARVRQPRQRTEVVVADPGLRYDPVTSQLVPERMNGGTAVARAAWR